MSERLIIPISTIKTFANIENSVESDRLRPSVITAQRIHLQNVIGTSVFKYYLDRVGNDGQVSGLTDVQSFLLTEYLSPMICLYTEAEYTVAGNYHRSNMGSIKSKDEKGEASSLAEVRYLQDLAMERADFYAQRAKVYLCSDEVREDPLYQLYQSTKQNIEPAMKVTTGFIYTGPRRQ